MPTRLVLCLASVPLLFAGQAHAQATPFSAQDQAELSRTLRKLIVGFLPNPLLEDAKHWGGQKEVANGVTWKRKRLLLKPTIQKKMKNHGQWWKVKVEAVQANQTLRVDLRNMHRPKKDHLTFTAHVAMLTRTHYDRQHWRAGVRTYSGSVRARAVVRLTLHCEATTRVVRAPDKLLPDVFFRLRVTKANLSYDNITVEHVPGLGGEAAEILGRMFYKAVHKWKPSLERNMIEKANAAIVKAGDTKDIKLSLGNLMGQ